MNKQELLGLIEDLNLTPNNYVIFGGGTLTLREIRDCGDVDLFVTEQQYAELHQQGWAETFEANRSPYLIANIGGIGLQAFDAWEGPGWQPNLAAYLREPEMVAGLPCMPLRELYDWKEATRRPKDVEDLQLIQQYWDNGGL